MKRGRNEGTAYLSASNVMGNGNITARAGIGGLITRKLARANSHVGLSMGIAEILQFDAEASFINFNQLGPAAAHLQVTTPRNDRLRFVGVAVRGDLHLSTALDTIALEADSSKPEYRPYPGISATVDLDWFSRPKRIPLKVYLFAGLTDDPEVLHRYSQLALRTGAEWKMLQHSFFVDAGVGLYKEKRTRLNRLGEKRFGQSYVWISPGARYRFANRFSLVGDLRWTVFRRTRDDSSLDPEAISLTVRLEAPILFRETDTEAIRTLVFMDQEKEREPDQFARKLHPRGGLLGEYDESLLGLGQGTTSFDYESEKEQLRKRREEIQNKMIEIEQLLREIE